MPEGESLQLPHGLMLAWMRCAVDRSPPPSSAPNRHWVSFSPQIPIPCAPSPAPPGQGRPREPVSCTEETGPPWAVFSQTIIAYPPFLPATEKKEELCPPTQDEVPGVPNGSRWAPKATNPRRTMSKEESSEKKDPQPSPLPHLVLGLRALSSHCSNHLGSLTA